MKKGTWTLADIEKYYGSCEAYNEEQRRCGLAELEETQRNGQQILHLPGYASALIEQSQGGTARPRTKARLRFNFFGAK